MSYIAVPSLDVAKIAAEYAEKNNIRFIIDVQDLWPEAFKMVFNVPFISDILFYPMLKQADYIYKAADEIIAVSQTYTEELYVLIASLVRDIVFSWVQSWRLSISWQKKTRLRISRDEIWLAYVVRWV